MIQTGRPHMLGNRGKYQGSNRSPKARELKNWSKQTYLGVGGKVRDPRGTGEGK